MSVDERVLAVIEALYDAAADHACWPAALSSLTAFMESEAATFWVMTTSDTPQLPLFTYIDLEPAFVDDYVQQAAPIDPTVQYLVAHPDQPVVHDAMVIAEREKDRHPYYDWQSRYSDMRFRLVGQLRVAPGVQAGVALHRRRRTGRFESGEVEQFRYIARHLEQALRIAFRLGSLTAMQQFNAELLDAHASSIVLLDTSRRVVYTNRRAEALRGDGDGIVLDRHGIRLLDQRDDTIFQGLISQLMPGGGSKGSPRVQAMRAARPSGRRAYGVLVAAVGGRYPPISHVRPAVCVMVNDPESEAQLPRDLLRSTFGFTGAETDLASRLAAGDDLRSAAERLGITYGTARTRLAEIFQKTDTRRQGELIRLLLTTFAGQ